ncbi:hypothetical protein CR956_00745 [Candidatus Saccharibacteria bacterium]|nr:MAG: hypothetical protein CR956_00745 [Candidatus Saccharibacteria bacterium]
MSIQEIAGYVSFVLMISSGVPYLLELFRGKVKPERVSWFVWLLLGVVYLWSAIIEGGAVLFTASALIGPVLIFLLSFKYGVGGKNSVDMVMLVLALGAIGLMITTDDSFWSIVMALVADAIAGVLTIVKLHKDPSSESRLAWTLSATSSLFAIISLQTFTFESLAFPVYLLIFATYLAIFAKPLKVKEPLESGNSAQKGLKK